MCKRTYRDPVVTTCDHYYCESCALTRYKKDPGYAICGLTINGISKSAKKSKRFLGKKRSEGRGSIYECLEVNTVVLITALLADCGTSESCVSTCSKGTRQAVEAHQNFAKIYLIDMRSALITWIRFEHYIQGPLTPGNWGAYGDST